MLVRESSRVDSVTEGDLFIILLDAVLTKQDTGHGTNGYYFGESGEHSLYDVGKAIAEVLVDLGIGKSREPTTFTKEEIDKYFQGVCRVVEELNVEFWTLTRASEDGHGQQLTLPCKSLSFPRLEPAEEHCRYACQHPG